MPDGGNRRDSVFTGSIPKLYESRMVPLVFEPYARDLVDRLGGHDLSRVLEVAAGTGVVTRVLADVLPESVAIVATDPSQEMLDEGARVGTSRPVEWRQADAMQLPFPDAAFDAVVCQFGVMFFPDKARSFAEVRRVLKRGGIFVFSVWDRIAANEFADTVTTALATMFPANPPRFMARTPHGYHDRDAIERDLALGGFTAPARFATLPALSRAASARVAAEAYCQGSPLRGEIEGRDATLLGDATELAAEALAVRFGRGEIQGRIQAHIVTVIH